MMYTYRPKGVCSHSMDIELDENHVIKKVVIVGGCSGNSQGICSLVKGMTAEEAIARMRGIRCGMKATSCPDQLARALEEALQQA